MNELTGEEYFPNDTYHTQWFLFWILATVSGILLWLNFFRPAPITESPRPAISAGYDWFLVLHMPEMPNDPTRAEGLRRHYDEWLSALVREGYHPMLLTEVEKRWAEGTGLPERAVVMVFDPAYNHTYETLAPLLVQYRFPALWVTDHTAILRGDRHFIHRRQAKWMVRSGFWDLAYSGDGFWRKASDANTMIINESHEASWVPGTGHTALNWASRLPQLNRLDVSPKWTAADLIARLEMELPLQGTVHLGVRHVQGRLWGVVLLSPQKNNSFSFQAPLASAAANLYWFGTRGAPDIRLNVHIPSFFGEASVWMRSDYKSGQGIGVGFTHKEFYVDQKVQGVPQRLYHARWTPPDGAITGSLTLTGTLLQVAMDGAKPVTINLSPETPSPEGMVRLQVFDPVRGAARVDFVDLVLTALSKSPH